MSLQNKVALVTGSGRGIGAASAKLLAQKGARVFLSSRTEAELQKVAGEIETAGGIVAWHASDLSKDEGVQSLFNALSSSFGHLDILVNNAAVLVQGPFESLSLEDWELSLKVNVTSLMRCAQFAFPMMKKSGGGSIVNISSLAGIRGTEKFPGFSAYTTSKHAVVGLTEALAAEGRQCDIRVNAIAPGAVATKMLEQAAPGLKANAQPEDIAKIVSFLADKDQSGVVTGSILEVFCNADE